MVLVLNELYKSLNDNIQTTLVQYINGMIKNIKDEAREDKKRLTKKKWEETLKKKVENISEDLVPTFKCEKDAEIYIQNLPQGLFKLQINKMESVKLMNEFKKVGKNDNFIKTILNKYFEII